MIFAGRSRVQMPQFVRVTFHSLNHVAIGFTLLVVLVKIVEASTTF